MSQEHQEFMALVNAHGAAVLAMLRRLCGNPHDAEDMFQETAVRVWRNFGNRPTLRSPRGWLITVAYRVFLDQRTRQSDHVANDEPVDCRSVSAESLAEQAEWRDRLNAAIQALAAEGRELVLLHYAGGLTLSESAAALGVPVGTAKSRLNVALNKLRSVLE